MQPTENQGGNIGDQTIKASKPLYQEGELHQRAHGSTSLGLMGLYLHSWIYDRGGYKSIYTIYHSLYTYDLYHIPYIHLYTVIMVDISTLELPYGWAEN